MLISDCLTWQFIEQFYALNMFENTHAIEGRTDEGYAIRKKGLLTGCS